MSLRVPRLPGLLSRKGEDLGFLPGPPGESSQPTTPAQHRLGAPAGRVAWLSGTGAVGHAGLHRRGALLSERGAAKMGAHPPSPGKAQASGALKQMRCQAVPGATRHARVPGPGQARTEGRGAQRPEALAGLCEWPGRRTRPRALGSRSAREQEPVWSPPGTAWEQTGPAAGCALPDSSVTCCPLGDVGLHPQTRCQATTGSGRKQPVPICPPPLRSWHLPPAGLARAGCPALGTAGRAELGASQGKSGQGRTDRL